MIEIVKKKVGMGLLGVMLASSVGMGALTQVASAVDPGPLAVSCSGVVATNTITWTATTTGGVAPFSYLWSGTNVSGTASSVTATYAATGTYSAAVQVSSATTSTTSTATSTCFAAVVVLPPVTPTSTTPTSTTPTSTTPTSTHGQVNVQPMLNINPAGIFLGRGMVVTSVGSSSFQAQIWGITYTINVSGSAPEFFVRKKIGGSFNMSQLQVGDVLGVSGRIVPATPLVVQAQVVRNYSIVDRRVHKDDDDDDREEHGNKSVISNFSTKLGVLKNIFEKGKEVKIEKNNKGGKKNDD